MCLKYIQDNLAEIISSKESTIDMRIALPDKNLY